MRALTLPSAGRLHESRYTFSAGVEVGGRVVLSGQTAARYDSGSGRMVVPGDLEQQTHAAYDKIEAILASAGSTLDDAVHVVENVTAGAMARYGVVADVRLARLGDATPAVSTVCVDRLVRPDALIEVRLTAASGGGSRDASRCGAARKLGHLVYLPSILPTDDEGNVVGRGEGVERHAAAAMSRAERMLAACGFGRAHIAQMVRFTRADAHPLDPTDVVMSELSHSGALVQLEILAASEPPVPIQLGPVRATRSGDVMFLSAQAGCDDEAEGRTPPYGDVVAEARHVYERILEALDGVGSSSRALIETVEYVSRRALPRYRGTARVRRELLQKPYPASTGLACRSLGSPGAHLQVRALAALRSEEA